MAPERDFTPDPTSARAVRQFVGREVATSPSSDDIVLAASELAANVIRHARTRFTVRVTFADAIRLEVSDGSSILPAVEDLTESSRGLRMIEVVSERWGVEASEDGKTVWAEFT